MTNEIINGQGVKEWIKFNNPVSCESEAAWEGKDNTTEKNYLCTREMVLSDPLISSIKDEIEDIAKLGHEAKTQLGQTHNWASDNWAKLSIGPQTIGPNSQLGHTELGHGQLGHGQLGHRQLGHGQLGHR